MMRTESTDRLTLESLGDGVPAIPVAAVGFYIQNCMVAFHYNDHRSGVRLAVHHDDSIKVFEIVWAGEVTEQMLRAYRDSKRFTDFAACTIALLLVRDITPFTAIEQSCTGTTIDYYLVYKNQDLNNNLIFNNAARLEVSGILSETEDNTIDRRVGEKRRRLRPEGGLLDLIAVIEFSRPWSKLVRS